MANLKDELDQYLLLQSDQKKNFKLDMKMPTIKVPEIKSLFGKSQPQEANGWLQDTQDSCCPKLVNYLENHFNFNENNTDFFLLVYVVEDAEDFWIFSVFKFGNLLHVSLSSVHPRTNIKGTKIRTTIFIGQFILHIEVR